MKCQLVQLVLLCRSSARHLKWFKIWLKCIILTFNNSGNEIDVFSVIFENAERGVFSPIKMLKIFDSQPSPGLPISDLQKMRLRFKMRLKNKNEVKI